MYYSIDMLAMLFDASEDEVEGFVKSDGTLDPEIMLCLNCDKLLYSLSAEDLSKLFGVPEERFIDCIDTYGTSIQSLYFAVTGDDCCY